MQNSFIIFRVAMWREVFYLLVLRSFRSHSQISASRTAESERKAAAEYMVEAQAEAEREAAAESAALSIVLAGGCSPVCTQSPTQLCTSCLRLSSII
jgi:hypothetical protein